MDAARQSILTMRHQELRVKSSYLESRVEECGGGEIPYVVAVLSRRRSASERVGFRWYETVLIEAFCVRGKYMNAVVFPSTQGVREFK